MIWSEKWYRCGTVPTEIARLGEKAFEKLKREYSSEVIYQKWDNLFQKLIKE